MNPADVDELAALLREKPDATKAEKARLAAGEPLAYIIGNQPFLGLTIGLESKPLIPRPETEWWTERLCAHIGERPLRVLDLCAGSGAIGLAVLKYCPNAQVSFGELNKRHREQIQHNIEVNGLDKGRATIRSGDLFEPFKDERFDIIAVNPPYVPDRRELEASVVEYEPGEALYGGEDGLSVIRRIWEEVPVHILPGGEVWMECDIDNIEEAATLSGTRTEIHNDLYGRPRIVVAYY